MSCRWSKYTLQGGIKTKTELVSTKIRKELEEQGGKEEQNIQGIGDKSREDSVVTSKRNRHYQSSGNIRYQKTWQHVS